MDQNTNSTLRSKLKQTLCFSSSSSSSHNYRHRRIQSNDNYIPPSKSSWIWIKTSEHDFPEIRDKCINVFRRIANHSHHRKCPTHDPFSYALNFHDDEDDSFIDAEVRIRNSSSSRLPPSTVFNLAPEITAIN